MDLRRFSEELPSTQAEAIRLAKEGAAEGTRVVARRQTAGVGRRDHRWSSPTGGLYLSMILRSPGKSSGLVALATGSSLRDRLADDFSVQTLLKWPNDLMATVAGRGRKLSGILADEVGSPTLGRAVVVGVGMNVTTPPDAFPPELRGRVVSLASLTQTAPNLDEVERITVRATEDAVRALPLPYGASKLLGRARDALYGQGQPGIVDGKIRGIIRTIGDEGELWLETPGGNVAIRAGDLVVEDGS